jgi:S1-C subfamily serine protease
MRIAAASRPAIVSIQGNVSPDSFYGRDFGGRFGFPGRDRRDEAHRRGMAGPPEPDKSHSETPEKRIGTGSGFLLRGGYVVTTAEVTVTLTDMKVILPDGRRVAPEWVNTYREGNISVLKVADASPDVGLTWGPSARIAPGSMIITLGNQGGFPGSMMLGIVSGTDRIGRAGPWRYRNLIQFQGSVSGGSGGGAVLDSRGEVIGMIVAMPASPDARYDGLRVLPAPGQNPGRSEARQPGGGPSIPGSFMPWMFRPSANSGFALPSDSIRPLVETLCRRETPPPRDGWVGFQLERNPQPDQGMRIEAIYEGGPADRAGLAPGDVILEVNGDPIHGFREIGKYLWDARVGVTLNITVLRGGMRRSFTLTTTPRPFGDEMGKFKRRELHPKTTTITQAG